MKKNLIALVLAAAMLSGLTVSAIAAGNAASAETIALQDSNESFVASPSGSQGVGVDDQEIEVVTDNVVTGGYILEIGTPEPRPLEQIDYPVIKVTTLAMSTPSNAKVDAANPGASTEQKAGIMTDSGLSYGKNATINEVADSYYAAQTTSDFIRSYEMSLFDRIASMTEKQLADYSVIQIADISANNLAAGTNKSVRLTFTTPGVQPGSRVKVGRIQNNSLEFISATAGDGSISFKVNPNKLGIFVLMTCVEQ